MTTKLQTYPKYKPSGIDWFGDVPNGWQILAFKQLFQPSNERIKDDPSVDTLLSVSGYRGVAPKDISSMEGQMPSDDISEYRIVRKGQLAVNTMWLNYAGLGVSEYEGYISPAYRAYDIKSDINKKFVHYLLRSPLYVQKYTSLLYGVRPNSLQVKPYDFEHIEVLLPSIETQKQIADFLDEKTKVIDELMAKKEKLTELLREKRAALITRVVTKGLNLNTRLKPSGVDWLGDIPEGWNIKRNRFLGTYQKGKTADICTSDEKDCLPYLSAEVIRGLKEPEFCRGLVVAKEEQILLLWDGANAGEFFWAGPGVVSSTFSLILPWQKIIPRFYYWLLKGFERVLRDYTQGMGIPHVSPWILKDSFLPEVPIEEQKQIADFLDAETGRIDKAVKLIEAQIEELKEYRSSLIYHAVTGKKKYEL